MIFVSVEDFCEKAAHYTRLSRPEEIEYARKMQQGDPAAREKLIQSYLPMVAGYIRRVHARPQDLGMVIYCVHALEKAVDSFDFLQDSEPFSHRLSWWLRQAVTKYIAR